MTPAGAENRLTMHLAPGRRPARLGTSPRWDFPAPACRLPAGSFQQHLEVPGLWLERGLIDAADTRLLDSPAVPGRPPLPGLGVLRRRQPRWDARSARGALDAAREVIDAHPPGRPPPAPPAPNGRVVIVRALAPLVEPAMDLMQRVRGGLARPFLATATDAAADLGDVVRSTQAGHPASHCHPLARRYRARFRAVVSFGSPTLISARVDEPVTYSLAISRKAVYR
jgi:hypothetical protein